VTFTRIAARFPTRGAAEDALAWAARYAVKVPQEIGRHECSKPEHQAGPWLLVSAVRIGEEREPAVEVAAVGVNGRRSDEDCP
jgi:hypothetical protein